ncbi:MAG: PLDc N-terminal domain-containing protein [Planctomycetota bacterium]|nr:PLDc N-terminal domain-containing protein [Planctomycetota bacterium]
MVYGIGGLLLLALDIYVILLIVGGGGDPMKKLVWILLVLFLPLLGPILYLLLARNAV